MHVRAGALWYDINNELRVTVLDPKNVAPNVGPPATQSRLPDFARLRNKLKMKMKHCTKLCFIVHFCLRVRQTHLLFNWSTGISTISRQRVWKSNCYMVAIKSRYLHDTLLALRRYHIWWCYLKMHHGSVPYVSELHLLHMCAANVA